METIEIETITKPGRGRPINSHRAFYETKQIQYKQYNSTHYEKRKNDESIICPLCRGRYKYCNKSHHIKSKKHIKQLTINADEKLILSENIISSEI
jgi:hypothetical protein